VPLHHVDQGKQSAPVHFVPLVARRKALDRPVAASSFSSRIAI
jgi:hypothetical protein